MTLRARVTLGFAATLAVLLGALSATLYGVMAFAVRAEVDRSVKARAEDVAAFIRVVPRFQLDARFVRLPDVDVFAASDVFIQVLDAGGRPVALSHNLLDQTFPAAPADLPEAQWLTVRVGDARLRVYHLPYQVDGRLALVIQAARSLKGADFTLLRLRWALAIGSFLTLLASGFVVAWLTGALVRPLSRITQTALEIEASGDLATRVEHRGPQDEVGRFAAAFNAMLARLEQAYARLNAAYEGQRRFLADLSHQLRTPLTVVRGNVDLLRQMAGTEGPGGGGGPGADEERTAILADTQDAVKHMAQLVDRLLTLGRADAGQALPMEELMLGDVLDEVARQGRGLARDRRFEVGQGAPATLRIRGSRDYLIQLFLILVENAVKYTPPGGSIRLEARAGGDRVAVAVADDGMGISPQHLPRIFDRFYRAPEARAREGSGLGLAIARWIATQHGGDITVESEPGRGSRFTVILPVSPA